MRWTPGRRSRNLDDRRASGGGGTRSGRRGAPVSAGRTGDANEAFAAAAALGDDRIQRTSRGHVVPEAFTREWSRQRVRRFRRGLAGGDPSACDAFAVAAP